MRIDVITLFPDFIQTAAELGVVGRAKARGLIEIATWNPRDFALDSYRSADERPYGGGPGMVMLVAESLASSSTCLRKFGPSASRMAASSIEAPTALTVGISTLASKLETV